MSFEQEAREKLDKILAMQSEHTTQLAVYNVQLKHHIKRSDLLEVGQAHLEERMKPIENHILFVDKMAKGIVTLAAVVSALAGFVHFFVK